MTPETTSVLLAILATISGGIATVMGAIAYRMRKRSDIEMEQVKATVQESAADAVQAKSMAEQNKMAMEAVNVLAQAIGQNTNAVPLAIKSLTDGLEKDHSEINKQQTALFDGITTLIGEIRTVNSSIGQMTTLVTNINQEANLRYTGIAEQMRDYVNLVTLRFNTLEEKIDGLTKNGFKTEIIEVKQAVEQTRTEIMAALAQLTPSAQPKEIPT